MTTTVPATTTTATAIRRRRALRTPTIMAVASAIGILLALAFVQNGTSTFDFVANSSAAIRLPDLVIPTVPATYTLLAIAAAMTVAAFVWVRRRAVPIWYSALFGAVLLLAFFIAASSGGTLPFTSLFVGTIALSTPLIYGVLGGVLSERVGVINVAIEGQLLAGAFLSAVVASITGSAAVGMIAATIAGALVAAVLAAFSVKYLVNQVVIGIVLNVLVLGLTTFIYQTVLVSDPTLNTPPLLPRLPIPLLGDVPVLGPALFNQPIIVYLMYLAVAVVTVGLYKTPWGLRLRAVGEHPQAADTVGINVARTRNVNVIIAGGIAGLGGSFFTLGSVGLFSQNMTSGAGFIALAAVIFGRWDPIRGMLAALLFGFVTNLQSVLGILGIPIPSQFLLMLPYLATILAVAGLVGRVRGPAAAGQPYSG